MEALRTASELRPVDIAYDQDFIVIYRALDAALCRAVVELFDADAGKRHGRIGVGDNTRHEDRTKVSWDLEIRNEGAWQDVFGELHPRIQRCLADYLSRSPVLGSFDLQGTAYKIQMYPRDEGHFRWHADSVGKGAGDRVVAMVLYLNDVAAGGETEFYHQGFKIPPRAGNLVLFPAGWNYMHCGHMPRSGDKYVISSFVRIRY
jgi:hypothetical protein